MECRVQIEQRDAFDSALDFQGTLGGLRWSLTITDATGRTSLWTVGDRVAFVVFGRYPRL